MHVGVLPRIEQISHHHISHHTSEIILVIQFIESIPCFVKMIYKFGMMILTSIFNTSTDLSKQ